MKKSEIMKIVGQIIRNDCIKHDSQGRLYYFESGDQVWKLLDDYGIRQVINLWSREFYREYLTHSELEYLRQELSEEPELMAPELDSPYYSTFIRTQNVRLDLKTLQTENPDKKFFDKIILNFHYEPSTKISEHSAVAKFLKAALKTEVIDPQRNRKVRSLFQSTAYVLSSVVNIKKAPILLGPPNSGKSVWLDLCSRILGVENVRYLALQDLTDKFRSGLLQGSRLVMCHEVRLGALKRLDIPKAIISGNPITIEAKGVQPWTYTPDVKLMMAANALPTLGEIDAGGAFADRLIVIPFHSHEGTNDPDMLSKLYEERDDLFSVIFQTMPSFFENNMQLEEIEESKSILKEYHINGNPLTAFLTATYDKGTEDDCISTKALYEEYKIYCMNNVLPVCSISEFRPQLSQLGHYIRKKRIQGYRNPISTVSRLKPKQEE